MLNTKFKYDSRTTETDLREEVEKRYLAYALSTIVSRALPDVRDGLKPVHRRILYAMHAMRLNEVSKMRKSAAVVGEVIGKYHPHGDQAAYDALVRMAQDFSLRYPLVDGSGNFGSLDGDAPAAMRYTEIRLSAFAGYLLKEIDQGTTTFRPTYDAMGQEPDVLPAAVPNLLLNGSSGIAVGMSCSFPPHNISEVLAACREAIRNPALNDQELLQYIKGPDFPTGGEILTDDAWLADIYRRGHGAVRLRGTYHVEPTSRAKSNLVITSIPYSVNKSRLMERIAGLIMDKKLKHVQDVRDESTDEVRIVLELKGGDVTPETVMAFLFKHTDLQINFPINLIAITPQGVPDRLSLSKIIRYFLDFRYDKTVLRLQYRLAALEKRIHILQGFDLLFENLDAALRIIRSARTKQEASSKLKESFNLDDEQVEAVLEMRMYKLVGLEMGKVVEELRMKRRESLEIIRNLASPDRLWKIIDSELHEISGKFGGGRLTRIVRQKEASALDYDPDQFVEHEDTTVILSKQGWIRRTKSEVEDPTSLKFREGDELFGWARVNTGCNVAIFSNNGKVYVIRAIDVPATTGFGEPIGNILKMADGETVVGFLTPDPINNQTSSSVLEDTPTQFRSNQAEGQMDIFSLCDEVNGLEDEAAKALPSRGILASRRGKGFRFDYQVLRETSKRAGRKLMNLAEDDETVAAMAEEGKLLVIGASSGNVLVFPVDQVPLLNGPGQGIRLMKLQKASDVVSIQIADTADELVVRQSNGQEKSLHLEEIQVSSRGGKGTKLCAAISGIQKVKWSERSVS